MKFNEVDQEIFDNLISEFVDKYGEELGHKIIQDVFLLHRKIARNLKKKNLAIAFIYRNQIKKKMAIPVKEGGYMGMQIKDISKIEYVSIQTLSSILCKDA